MRLHNSLSNKTEEFKPIEGNKVSMYVCGPTVYDFAHLGHARCYITWDVLYRYLKFRGYDVTYARNVTDVDDKILKKADAEGKTPEEVSTQWYRAFVKSMEALNTCKPDIEPFATKTIGEMIALIKDLIEKGFAYEVGGDVYFRVKKFERYGELSKQPIDALAGGQSGQKARVEENPFKEDALDFALWKRDEAHGYPSPWGKGRPGWHIECSAMSRKHLGKTIDIHAGGADLVFPHHENEIAQSECANGCKFVNYWLHNGFVTINKEKMSKSLGNFLTIDNLLEKYDANTIRFFILTNHYRMPVEFSNEALSAAANGVKRLTNAKRTAIDENFDITTTAEYGEFVAAMDDDMNTAKALAVLFELANKANKDEPHAFTTLFKLADVLGFTFDKPTISEAELAKGVAAVNKELGGDFKSMEEINAQRNAARAEKNYSLADKIRIALDSAGIVLKDTKEGTTWELK
jgi:cysteinyl-tRNA synthetase